MGSLDWFVLEFDDVLLRNVETLQLADLLLLDLFDKNLLGLPRLLELFVLELLLLEGLLPAFLLVHDLLLQLVCVLLQEALSLLLQLLLDFLELALFANCCFKLSLFSLRLLFESPLLLDLLLNAGLLKFLGLLCSDLSLYSIFFSCSTLVSLNCSLGPQSIELSLPVRSFLLKLPESLNLLLLLFFDASK